MQLKVKKGAGGVLADVQGKRDQSCAVAAQTTSGKVTDKFTESMYVLANEPSVALYRLQEHVRRSLPELAQHKSDMQSWEEQSQGAIYTVEYACSAIKNMTDSSVYFKSIDSLLKHAIAMKDQLNAAQGRSTVAPQAKNPPASS
ncbi:BLOC-1-related complex subunit 8 isoform X1 [Strix uralensis]|uniref:BLOC-1-related complex subunit 8 isoform X1 n=1 Tax=Strix uralensis TaxID=36305 RepID=UPI003DA75C14